jgi:ribosomal protein S18 acetylase RimI-like enzyme
MEGRLEPVDQEYVRDHLGELWGWPVLSTLRAYRPEDRMHGLVWRDEWGQVQGLIAYHVDGDTADIVSVDAYQQGRHIGGRLLDGAEAHMREHGVRHVIISTTNDNLRAVAFYVRRGYRLTKVDLDAMDRVRALKPHTPFTGNDGIPLRDMLQLEKDLV